MYTYESAEGRAYSKSASASFSRLSRRNAISISIALSMTVIGLRPCQRWPEAAKSVQMNQELGTIIPESAPIAAARTVCGKLDVSLPVAVNTYRCRESCPRCFTIALAMVSSWLLPSLMANQTTTVSVDGEM